MEKKFTPSQIVFRLDYELLKVKFVNPIISYKKENLFFVKFWYHLISGIVSSGSWVSAFSAGTWLQLFRSIRWLVAFSYFLISWRGVRFGS